MAEAIGLAASVLGIAGFGAKLSMSLYQYSTTIRHARREIAAIASEMTLFASVLQQVGEFLENEKEAYSSDLLESMKCIVSRCDSEFRHLRRGLRRAKRAGVGSRKRFRGVSWLFNKYKALEKKTSLEGLKSTLMPMMQTVTLAKKASDAEKHSEADVEALKRELEVLKSLIIANHQTILDLHEAADEDFSEPKQETARFRPGKAQTPPSNERQLGESNFDLHIVGVDEPKPNYKNRPSALSDSSWRDAPVVLASPPADPPAPPTGLPDEPENTEPVPALREHLTSSGEYPHQQHLRDRQSHPKPLLSPNTIHISPQPPEKSGEALVPVLRLLSEQIPHPSSTSTLTLSGRPRFADQSHVARIEKHGVSVKKEAAMTVRLLLDKWTIAGSGCLTTFSGEAKLETQGKDRDGHPGLTSSMQGVEENDGSSTTSDIRIWRDEDDSDSDDSLWKQDEDKATDSDSWSIKGGFHTPPKDYNFNSFGAHRDGIPPSDMSGEPDSGKHRYPHGNHNPAHGDPYRERSTEFDRELQTAYIERLKADISDRNAARAREEEEAKRREMQAEARAAAQIYAAWQLPGTGAGAPDDLAPGNAGNEQSVDLLARLETLGKGAVTWKRCSKVQKSFFAGPRAYFHLMLTPPIDAPKSDCMVSAVEIGREWIRPAVLQLFGYPYEINDGVYRILRPLNYPQVQLLVRNSLQLVLDAYAKHAAHISGPPPPEVLVGGASHSTPQPPHASSTPDEEPANGTSYPTAPNAAHTAPPEATATFTIPQASQPSPPAPGAILTPPLSDPTVEDLTPEELRRRARREARRAREAAATATTVVDSASAADHGERASSGHKAAENPPKKRPLPHRRKKS